MAAKATMLTEWKRQHQSEPGFQRRVAAQQTAQKRDHETADIMGTAPSFNKSSSNSRVRSAGDDMKA
jgi:hypothetical protein